MVWVVIVVGFTSLATCLFHLSAGFCGYGIDVPLMTRGLAVSLLEQMVMSL